MPRAPLHPDALSTVADGLYHIRAAGHPCGEERWRIEADAGHIVVTGEQWTDPPHPFPNRQAWRATLTPEWRPTGFEVRWEVGPRTLAATHAAEGDHWRVRIEHEGRTREQEGDYPSFCEVEFPSHLSSLFILARRDFAVGGEHEFPVLRIGPPWMAVHPDRMLLRCVEQGAYRAPWGEIAAKRYLLSLPPRSEAEGYTFWADERGVVLESFEGPEPAVSWMRLVEHRWR
jgi:hypothetical protein